LHKCDKGNAKPDNYSYNNIQTGDLFHKDIFKPTPVCNKPPTSLSGIEDYVGKNSALDVM